MGKVIVCEEDGTVAEIVRGEVVSSAGASARSAIEAEVRRTADRVKQLEREGLGRREAIAAANRSRVAKAAWRRRSERRAHRGEAPAQAPALVRPLVPPGRPAVPRERKPLLKGEPGSALVDGAGRSCSPILARFRSALRGAEDEVVAVVESDRSRNWVAYRGRAEQRSVAKPRMRPISVFVFHRAAEPFMTLLPSELQLLRAGRADLRSGAVLEYLSPCEVKAAKPPASASAQAPMGEPPEAVEVEPQEAAEEAS